MSTFNYNSEFDSAILNVIGQPSDDFIQEVYESETRKKNQLYFALFVNGIPGDPAFGVGLSELVGEENVMSLERQLEYRARNTLEDLTEGVRYEGIVVDREPSQQYTSVDLYFTDLDTQKDILIPIGFKGTGSTVKK